MKFFYPYQNLLKAILTGLMLIVLCVNIVPCLDWILDTNQTALELCDPFDNEEKEEKKNKEDPDDKIQVITELSDFFDPQEKWKIFLTADYPSLFHPEIQTPPPKRLVFLS